MDIGNSSLRSVYLLSNPKSSSWHLFPLAHNVTATPRPAKCDGVCLLRPHATRHTFVRYYLYLYLFSASACIFHFIDPYKLEIIKQSYALVSRTITQYVFAETTHRRITTELKSSFHLKQLKFNWYLYRMDNVP